jgi:hypothetical protein
MWEQSRSCGKQGSFGTWQMRSRDGSRNHVFISSCLESVIITCQHPTDSRFKSAPEWCENDTTAQTVSPYFYSSLGGSRGRMMLRTLIIWYSRRFRHGWEGLWEKLDRIKFGKSSVDEYAGSLEHPRREGVWARGRRDLNWTTVTLTPRMHRRSLRLTLH